jgi:hypothetical protein
VAAGLATLQAAWLAAAGFFVLLLMLLLFCW